MSVSFSSPAYGSALPNFLSAPTAAPVSSYEPAPWTVDLFSSTGATTPAPAPLTPAFTMPQANQVLKELRAELKQLIKAFGPAAPSTPTAPTAPTPAPHANGATDFVISSFNILSSSAGAAKGAAPAAQRMQGVVDFLHQHNVSVVGMQEMKTDQLADFKRLAGNEYDVFTGVSGFKNYYDAALAWRKDTWSLVSSGRFTVPSYFGIASQVPYVCLRNKQTGQEAYFVDAHNPTNTAKRHHQEGYRAQAATDEAAFVKQLEQQTGLPVFMVGDMNSVQPAYDTFTKGAPLVAANAQGGKLKHPGIDWIFGTKGVSFSGFQRLRDALVQRTTDHSVPFATAHIPASKS
ncbi:MAG TPA: endonuclease/exonuclease/phosphatase family protein [Oscillatoriaceae cyanobacterium]